MYPLTGAIYIKMKENLFRNIKYEIKTEVFKSNHLQTSGKTTRTVCSRKEKYLKQKKCLREEMGNFFVKKE